MKQSPNIDRLLSLSIAFLTVNTSLVSYTKKAEANPAVAAPLGACMVNPYCVIGVVVVAGVTY